jgi:hypothetical protein
MIKELEKSASLMGILGMPPDPELHPGWDFILVHMPGPSVDSDAPLNLLRRAKKQKRGKVKSRKAGKMKPGWRGYLEGEVALGG